MSSQGGALSWADILMFNFVSELPDKAALDKAPKVNKKFNLETSYPDKAPKLQNKVNLETSLTMLQRFRTRLTLKQDILDKVPKVQNN